MSLHDINSVINRVYPPPTVRIPVGTVVCLADGLRSDGPLKVRARRRRASSTCPDAPRTALQAGELALLIADDGTDFAPYKVCPGDGFPGSDTIRERERERERVK